MDNQHVIKTGASDVPLACCQCDSASAKQHACRKWQRVHATEGMPNRQAKEKQEYGMKLPKMQPLQRAQRTKSRPRALPAPSVVQPVVLPPVLPTALGKSRISRNTGVPGFPGCHAGAGKPEVQKSLPGRARPEPEPVLSLQIPWMAAGGKTGENPKIRETLGSRREFRHTTRRSHQPGRQRESGSNPDSDQPGGAQK